MNTDRNYYSPFTPFARRAFMNRYMRFLLTSCALMLTFSPVCSVLTTNEAALANDVLNAYSTLEHLERRTQEMEKRGLNTHVGTNALYHLDTIRSETVKKELIEVLSLTPFATEEELFKSIAAARKALSVFENKMKTVLLLAKVPRQQVTREPILEHQPSSKELSETLPLDDKQTETTSPGGTGLSLEDVPVPAQSAEPSDDLMKALDSPAASEPAAKVTRDLSALPLDD